MVVSGTLSVLFCRATCGPRSASSSSVRTCFPSSSFGRSSGVAVALVQVPCRSGWPHGVRGALQELDVAFCALAVAASGPATPIPAASTPVTMSNRAFISNLRSLGGRTVAERGLDITGGARNKLDYGRASLCLREELEFVGRV